MTEANCTSSVFPPSDHAPLASLYSSNQNPPEKSCRVTSDRAGKKRAATLSPRTLAASQNDQDYQWKLKKAYLDSTKKCLTSKFDCAQPSDNCLHGGVVFCGSIRNQRIQEYAKSSSAEVLKTLIRHAISTSGSAALMASKRCGINC